MRPVRTWRWFGLALALAMVAAACGNDDDGGAATTTTGEATTTTAGGTTTTGAAGGDLRNEIRVIDTVTVAAGEDTSPLIEPESGNRPSVNGTLALGAILPQTGDLAVLADPMIKAVEMAVAEINDAGGVLGNDVTLDVRDSGTDGQVAGAAADALLADGVVDAIIGAASSRVSLAIIDRITSAGVVQCSPSNTGLDFTTYEDGGYYFRTAPPDNLQAKAMVDNVILPHPDQPERIAIIALADAYGQGFANSLADQLAAAGLDVVENVGYDPSGTNFDADVDTIASAEPDAVVLFGFPDTGSIILQAMFERGLTPDALPIFVGDGMQSSRLGQLVDPENPAVVAGIGGTAPSASPPDGEPTFPERFAEFAPGVDTIFSAHAYDCAVVIALAAEQAGSDDPTEIARNMNEVTKGGTKCTTFAECKQLLADGEDIDYDGAAGALDFVNAGEPGAGTYDIWEFTDQVMPA